MLSTVPEIALGALNPQDYIVRMWHIDYVIDGQETRLDLEDFSAVSKAWLEVRNDPMHDNIKVFEGGDEYGTGTPYVGAPEDFQ